MKLLKKTSIDRGTKTKTFHFLALESAHDVNAYMTLKGNVMSRQAAGFWMAFKRDTFYHSPVDYAQHNDGFNIGGLLALNMELKGGKTSLMDYCKDADHFINDMHRAMLRYAAEGRVVRVNSDAGYCPIDAAELAEYDSAVDINEEEMYNHIVYGKSDYKFEVTSPTLVIENGKYVPTELVDKFCNITATPHEQVQVISNFKTKSILFRVVDFKNLFIAGIEKHGLKNIVFETTAQDTKQIEGLKQILQSVMFRYPERTLNIYVCISDYNKNKSLFETKSPNITITFLKR